MLILRRDFHLSRPFPQTHRPFACSCFDDTKSPPWIVAPSSRTAPWPALARYCTITPAAERSTSGDRSGGGEGQSVGILQRHTWSLAPFNLLPPDWCHSCGDQNYKKQDKRLLDGTLPPLVLLLVLCNCRDSRPQDRTAATTQTPTLAVLLYSAGTSSHSNTCGAHAVCSIALSKQRA